MHAVPIQRSGGPRGSRLPFLAAVLALALSAAACTSSPQMNSDSPAPVSGGSSSQVTGGGAVPPTDETEPSVPQAVVTAPVPPPAGNGDISETVAPRTGVTQEPVDLDAPAELGGLVVTVPSVVSTEADAVGPGEIGGPGIAVEIEVRNDGEEPAPLDGIFVTLVDAGGQVVPMSTTGDDVRPVTGILDPGATASGSYVFTLPESARSTVTVTVSDAGTATSVVFTGSAA